MPKTALVSAATGGAAKAEAGAKGKKRTRSSRANLALPIGRVHELLKRSAVGGQRVGSSAPVYLTAVTEYILSELLELATSAAKANKRKCVRERDLQLAIAKDSELSRLYAGTAVANGGVAPHIHRALLPKRRLAKAAKAEAAAAAAAV